MMTWTKWFRQGHRTLAPIFAATLVVTVVALALRGPEWLSYLPLPPLAFLFFSGAYLYARPFVAARCGGGSTGRARQSPESGSRPAASGVRRLHRWAAVAFTVTVPATFVALSLPEPLVWISSLPLIPLTLLFFSGLYQFVLPYRNARSVGVPDQRSAAA